MKNKCFFLLLCMIIVVGQLVGCSHGTAVHTHPYNDAYVLHAPVSKLGVMIPKRGFIQDKGRVNIGGGTNNPRYFWFQDDDRSIIISGWFDSAEDFTGTTAHWTKIRKSYEEDGFPTPKNVLFQKIGNWDTITWDFDRPPYISHISAHWLEAGTWIDIHISKTTDKPMPTTRTDLITELQTIRVGQYSLRNPTILKSDLP